MTKLKHKKINQNHHIEVGQGNPIEGKEPR